MDSEKSQTARILSALAEEDFVGRSAELEKLLRCCDGDSASCGLIVLSKPGNGLSEVLRQTYDRLFRAQGATIPVYFSFKTNEPAWQAARRFLQTVVAQTVAYRRNDEKMLASALGLEEIVRLAAPADGLWIDPLAALLTSAETDERLFARAAFGAPLRAAAHGVRIAVLMDDFQYVEGQAGETNLLDEIKDIYKHSSAPYVFAGRRRFLLDALRKGQTRLSGAEVLNLETLSAPQAQLLVERLSALHEVKIKEQTRDLLIRQFYASPFFISAMFRAARESGIDLDNFQRVEQLYTEELFGGAIGKYFQEIFEEVAPDAKNRRTLLRLLNDALNGERGKSVVESWRKRLEMSNAEFHRVARALHWQEIVNLNSSVVEVSLDNHLLCDFVNTRYRLEIEAGQRAQIVADTLANSLKRAPRIMASHYRRTSALVLRELLTAFNCQAVPESFFDYGKYKANYKGLLEAEIEEGLTGEAEKVILPQIVYTAHTVAFYPPIKQFSDEERSTVALGFETAEYRNESEIVWVAAEIDSKLEASRELAEFWCDRLEMVALSCNFPRYQLWLITPEGFSEDASAVLRQRSAFGSSRRQVELLAKELKAENVFSENLRSNEYEMIVPMGEDTEMIAAQTVEEIARRHHFEPKAINQIKTALVEACINASEHSHSPDRRIYQKFTVENDKIVITISNRGIKIPASKTADVAAGIEPDAGRRGWGLKLIRTLMDEVKFEQVDDGTRISMVKYLAKQAAIR